MDNLKTNECLFVSVDFTKGEDAGVLLVGRQKNGVTEIINFFLEQEAIDIYRKLITVEKTEN